MQDRKMNKQKIQLNYNKNYYTEQNKDNIIKDKNQLNDNKHDVGQLSKSSQSCGQSFPHKSFKSLFSMKRILEINIMN